MKTWLADTLLADVLGHTEIAFPVLSDEAFGDLELSLQPGWYALVFGSGLFDADGDFHLANLTLAGARTIWSGGGLNLQLFAKTTGCYSTAA